MILHDDDGAVVDSRSFTHPVYYRDALHLRGHPSYFIQGQNLHLLLPILAVGVPPLDLLQSGSQPRLSDVFIPPWPVVIRSAKRTIPPANVRLVGLGHALIFPIPRTNLTPSFLLEANGFATVHRQSDFRYLGPTKSCRDWHLVFTAQSYELSFDSHAQAEAFSAAVEKYFPGTQSSKAKNSINVLSVYDEPFQVMLPAARLPRFRVSEIREIRDEQVDTSQAGTVPPNLNPTPSAMMGYGTQRSTSFGISS